MDAETFKVRYRVKMVIDGYGKELSMGEAIQYGVLDIRNDKYINKKTGQRMSVTEAIELGLVTQMTPMERIMELRQNAEARNEARAARRNSSFARIQSGNYNRNRTTEDVGTENNNNGTAGTAQRNGSRLERSYSLRDSASSRRTQKSTQLSVVGCFYGLVSFRNVERILKYSIISAKDTRSGESWSFDKAKSKGIIDDDTEIYIDSHETRSMTFAEAIEQGFLEIRVESEIVNDNDGHDMSHYIVYGVMDLLDQRRITFKEALETFVLVRQPPKYRDTLHHMDMDLFDAICQRLVVAKPLEEQSFSLYDRMISEDNRLETDKETKVYKFDQSVSSV